MLGGVRSFLRKLLGVAEKEAVSGAEQTAAQLGKTAGRPTKSGFTVFEGGGESTSGPTGKLRSIAGGGETSVPKPPLTPEPVEMPRLKTGTDDAAVEAVGTQLEIKKPSAVDTVPGTTASAGNPPGGGAPAKQPALRSIKGGAGSEGPVPDVHVPPDRPPVRVDPRARGYAIEDLHMDALEAEGFERLPDWFKTHDAFKGGEETLVTEAGKQIRVIKGADAISIKSTQITEPEALTVKVTEDLDKLRGRFGYTREGLRLENIKGRRLDLIFEEGSDVTKATVGTIEKLQRDAGSIKLKWYVMKYGEKVPGPKWFSDMAKFVKDL